jgi:catechol 2,3-dioxygenase-like lactoylglutathione lyase family enzyme
MITRLSHVNVFVEDQDRAKAFYTEKLGFEVRSDTTMDGLRWLTVGPKDQPDLTSCSPALSRRCSARRTPRPSSGWSPRA